MQSDRLARLTERERAFLRLVAQAHSSKEIARRYSVEPGTVDKAVKSAMGKLGVSSRREAARLLALHEEGQKLGPPSQPLEPPIQPGTITDRDWQPALSSGAVREEQVPYWPGARSWQPRRLPVPRFAGERNELAATERLLWIGGTALGIIIALGTLITIAEGAGRAVASVVQALS